jgi:hypothetical protein
LAATDGTNEAWETHALEWPELDDDGQINWDLIWLYRRKTGVPQPRPHFTGDIFRDVSVIGEDAPATVVILQHPCALLDKHNELRTCLLAAKLADYKEIRPQEWQGNYDVMPLVVHDSDPLHHQAVAFDDLVLARSSELALSKRIACMEIEGVALLLQRWTNVNTRVVVPRWRFERVIEAQFAEADGMESWCTHRQKARVKTVEAMKEAVSWLDEKNEDTGKARRELFKDPQYRKNLVRRMGLVAKELSNRDLAEKASAKVEEQARPEAESATGTGETEVNESLNPRVE